MKLNDARDLAIKLFGIYCLLRFINEAPMIISAIAFTKMPRQHISNQAAYSILVLAAPLLNLLLGCIFLLKTDLITRLLWRNRADAEMPDLTGKFSFWITLIGVYYFVSSSASVATQLYAFATKTVGGTSYWFTKYFPDLLILPFSIIFILKAQGIADFIVKKQKKSANQQVDSDGENCGAERPNSTAGHP